MSIKEIGEECLCEYEELLFHARNLVILIVTLVVRKAQGKNL